MVTNWHYMAFEIPSIALFICIGIQFIVWGTRYDNKWDKVLVDIFGFIIMMGAVFMLATLPTGKQYAMHVKKQPKVESVILDKEAGKAEINYKGNYKPQEAELYMHDTDANYATLLKEHPELSFKEGKTGVDVYKDKTRLGTIKSNEATFIQDNTSMPWNEKGQYRFSINSDINITVSEMNEYKNLIKPVEKQIYESKLGGY